MKAKSYVNIQTYLMKLERQALDCLTRFRIEYRTLDENKDNELLKSIESKLFDRYLRRSDNTIIHRRS